MLDLQSVNHNNSIEYTEFKRGCGATIYHAISPNRRKVGLFFYNAGHRYRTGPNDLYVKIGVRLSTFGITVIAPDPSNTGDFFSHFNYANIPDHQTAIQQGLYVSDAVSSLKYFRKILGLDLVVVSGLCGGTRTALEVASILPVDGVIAWCCAFQMANKATLSLDENAPQKGFSTQTENPSSPDWKRKFYKLLKGDIDFPYQWQRVMRALGRNPSFDYKLAKLICRLQGKLPMEFIYSGSDRHYEVFKKYFLPVYDPEGTVLRRTKVLNQANHALGSDQKVDEFCCLVREFISGISK